MSIYRTGARASLARNPDFKVHGRLSWETPDDASVSTLRGLHEAVLADVSGLGLAPVKSAGAQPDVRAALQLAVRAGVAAVVSVVIARELGFDHPVYALIAVVVVMDLSPQDTRRRGLTRLAGTVLGAAVGGMLTQTMPSNVFTIGLGIMGSMLLCHVLRLQDGARLAGFVSGIVLINHGDDAWRYSGARLLETALGIGVAVVVSFVPKLLPSRPAAGEAPH